MILRLSLIFSVVFISSCRYGNSTNLVDQVDTTLNSEAYINYDMVKMTSLKTCANCHSGNQSPDLSSLNQIQRHISDIQDETRTAGMPPAESGYAALSDCNQAILDQWLSLGAPEETTVQLKSIAACKNQLTPPTEIPISQAPLTYDTLVTKFLQKKCLLCHNPDSSDEDAKQILFYPYSEVIKNPQYWQSPSASSKVVEEISGQDMPPSDSGISAATSEEVDFVKRWIDAGRPQ
ncbi:hypothetical protein CIK05_06100 [Bdellovibrio sp. qaytius]|nr:hypothetical protein CIK05_06100 [Bdellovibrio sp. qaytius]